METIYERTIRLIKERGFKSNHAFEKEAGLSNGMVKSLKDHDPLPKTAAIFAKALNVSISFFLTGEEAKPEGGEDESKVLAKSLIDGFYPSEVQEAIYMLQYIASKRGSR